MATLQDILKIHKPKPRYPIIREIANRWSPRFYDPALISMNDLKSMFEAARFAPSAHNHQPWYYFYAVKGSNAYRDLFSTLNEYNKTWAVTAPILILACAIVQNEHGENPHALYDLGASVISFILQAQSLGYYGRQMALFDKTKVRKYFRLEKKLEPFIIIALGKVGNYKKASQYILDLERDPRPRKTDFFRELK